MKRIGRHVEALAAARRAVTVVHHLEAVGHIVERVGVEADVTVTRVSADAFSIVTATAQTTRDLAWIRRHIGDLNATVTDVTGATAQSFLPQYYVADGEGTVRFDAAAAAGTLPLTCSAQDAAAKAEWVSGSSAEDCYYC